VPEFHIAILTSGCQPHAIGAERYHTDLCDVAVQSHGFHVPSCVPDFYLGVVPHPTRDGGQPSPVRAEGHALDMSAVSAKGAPFLARPCIPDFHGGIIAGRGEGFPVRAVHHKQHGLGMPAKSWEDLLAGGHVPDPHGLILLSRGSEALTIRAE